MVTPQKIESIQNNLRSLITDLEELKRSLPSYKEVKFDEKTHNITNLLKDLAKGPNKP